MFIYIFNDFNNTNNIELTQTVSRLSATYDNQQIINEDWFITQINR